MRSLLVLTVVLCVMVSMSAFAQSTSTDTAQKGKASAAPLKTIKGTVKTEGEKTTFVSDKDQKSWNVENPDTLKGHEGQHVTVKAHVYTDKDSIHVMEVKPAGAKAGETKGGETKTEEKKQ
ncbi:MAG TPA: hypothetical protein VE734_13370 [Terriglobales bacterium]|jgi:hypothetical protein|nr:hypothetical protein [Terriglobales bacterium]